MSLIVVQKSRNCLSRTWRKENGFGFVRIRRCELSIINAVCLLKKELRFMVLREVHTEHAENG